MAKENKYSHVPVSKKTECGMTLTIDDRAYLQRMFCLQDEVTQQYISDTYDKHAALICSVVKEMLDEIKRDLKSIHLEIKEVRLEIKDINKEIENLRQRIGDHEFRIGQVEKIAENYDSKIEQIEEKLKTQKDVTEN